MRRRITGVRHKGALAVLLLAFGIMFVPSAAALHATDHFELEGDIADGAATAARDWASLFDAAGGSLVGPDCAFAQDDLAQSGAVDRTIFAESNKNNDPIATWNWATGNVPVKDDLSNVYTCASFEDGDLVIYAGAERLAPEGASHIDFEFSADEIGLDQVLPCDGEQADDPPCEFLGEKQEGDFVVSMDFQQGGKLGSVSVRRWDGHEYVLLTAADHGKAEELQGCNPNDTICALSNASPVEGGPWPSYDRGGNAIETLQANQFTEFGVNVTDIVGDTPCIATFVVKTRSSPSFTSELMDFSHVPFNTCPTTSGTKYHDLNGNGERDAGEPGLQGWEIRAYADLDGDGALDAREAAAPAAAATTDSNGDYSLTLRPGAYVVCEVLQAGWTQSQPGGTACGQGDGLARGGYSVALGPNEEGTANDFGNLKPAIASGIKFHDLDADGSRDEGEPGLPGWTIYVDLDDDGALDADEPRAVTGEGGVYRIAPVMPGTFRVREVQQTAWFCSMPSPCSYTATFVSGGELLGNDFGNFQRATKEGVKYEDANRNGVRDAGERGLPGWTIRAYEDANENGVLDAGESAVAASATTDASGAYSMSLVPGRYVVCEALQAGWRQSQPTGTACAGLAGLASGGYAISLRSEEVHAANDFGNFPVLNVSIAKTDAPDPVTVGERITYTITVANDGPHTATGVVVTDPLPLDRVSFVSASASQGSCSGIRPMVCALGTLAPRATATITVVVTANVAGTVTNAARVVVNEEEETLSDNVASTTTLVVAPHRPPPSCGSLRLDRRTLTLGRRTVVHAVVRDTSRAAMAGVRVVARGAGVRTSARTNAAGVARLVVRPRRAGAIAFRVAGFPRCMARVGVPSAVTPQLTG
jgi:uncharacterized repeat protein (TIGR01451 family)